MLVFNLPRERVPEAATQTRVANDADPRSGTSRREIVSGSVTLAAAGTPGSEVSVPASALRAPEIRKALDARPPLVAVAEQKTETPPTAAPEPELKKRVKGGGRGE